MNDLNNLDKNKNADNLRIVQDNNLNIIQENEFDKNLEIVQDNNLNIVQDNEFDKNLEIVQDNNLNIVQTSSENKEKELQKQIDKLLIENKNLKEKLNKENDLNNSYNKKSNIDLIIEELNNSKDKKNDIQKLNKKELIPIVERLLYKNEEQRRMKNKEIN